MLSGALLALTAISCATHAATPGRVIFKGGFANGIAAWKAHGGSAQCADYGTPSKPPRLRGNLVTGRTLGLIAARFELPPSRPPSFPLEACEVIHTRPLGLGTDDYYGDMFYVPRGWRAGNEAFWGVAIAQFHFQNIWGSPIVFELHDDHVTLAVQTGACHDYHTPRPGCTWRSNADVPDGDVGNLGAHYVIPPHMRQGVWHEIIMRVHWASDNTGRIQVWHRIEGTRGWTQTVDLSGHPTVQWDIARGCCDPLAVDKSGAYRGPSTVAVSVWETNFSIGTGFGAVAATMPSRRPGRSRHHRRR